MCRLTHGSAWLDPHDVRHRIREMCQVTAWSKADDQQSAAQPRRHFGPSSCYRADFLGPGDEPIHLGEQPMIV